MMNKLINFTIIGLSILGIGVSVYYLNSQNESCEYCILFEEPITGLNNGSAVFANGINIGQVKSLELVKDDLSKVLVKIKTKPLVHESLIRAEICLQGISGHLAINVMYAKDKVELEPINNIAQLKSSPSMMYRIRNKLESIGSEENLNKVMSEVQESVNLLKKTFVNINDTLEKVNGVLSHSKGTLDALPSFVDNATSLVANLNQAMNDLVKNGALKHFIDQDLKNLSKIIGDVRKLTVKTNDILKDLHDSPVKFFTSGKAKKSQHRSTQTH